MNLIQKSFRFQVKEVQPDGTFEGYASVFGNVDSDGEVVDKGAFKRTLDHNKGVVPVLWQHDRTRPVGWNTEATEDGHGLKVKGKLLVETEAGRYALAFLKEGLEVGGKPGLSIGFVVPKDGAYYKDGVRHFREVALKEYSVVTFQANDDAVVTGAKGDKKTLKVDGVELPASSFAYVGDPEKPATWKLPIEFPGDDEKTKRHIRNALARFGQTQGIPTAERPKVLARIRRAAKTHGIDTGKDSSMQIRFKAEDFNSSLREAQVRADLNDLRWRMSSALCDAIDDICEDDSLTLDDKKTAIAESMSQYADAMSTWWGKWLDATAEDEDVDDPDDDKGAKEGRAISAATAGAMRKAMDSVTESMGYAKLSAQAKTKALGILTDLSNGRYSNDVNKPNPVGGGKSKSDPEDLHSLLEATRRMAQKAAR